MTERPPGLAVAFALVSLLPVPSLRAESRFEDVRLIVGRHGEALFRNEGFDDVRGTLTSDAQVRQLRFETASRVLLFEVSFDRLTSLHYEESRYPRLAFSRSRAYLTIHYTSAAGVSRFEILRLSKDSAASLLATVGRDTGLSIDRSPATTSFLGLPIHVPVGDIVYVTDNAGVRTRGSVAQLLPSSIELQPSGRFEAASVRKIEVSDPISDGAAVGAVEGLISGLFSTVACVSAPLAWCDRPGLNFWGQIAAGALVGALIDAKVMRDAYRRAESNKPQRVVWTPVLTGTRKGVQVSLRF